MAATGSPTHSSGSTLDITRASHAQHSPQIDIPAIQDALLRHYWSSFSDTLPVGHDGHDHRESDWRMACTEAWSDSSTQRRRRSSSIFSSGMPTCAGRSSPAHFASTCGSRPTSPMSCSSTRRTPTGCIRGPQGQRALQEVRRRDRLEPPRTAELRLDIHEQLHIERRRLTTLGTRPRAASRRYRTSSLRVILDSSLSDGEPRGAGELVPPARVAEDRLDLATLELTRRAPPSSSTTVICRVPLVSLRKVPVTMEMWRSRSSSSYCEPLSQASHPHCGNHATHVAGSPAPSVTPASSTSPSRLRATISGSAPVGERDDTVGTRDDRARLDPPANRRVPLNDGQGSVDEPTSHASARAPMILHFAGSSSREYSSSRGERSGCGSGHGVSPRPVTANATSTAASNSDVGDHVVIVPARTNAVSTHHEPVPAVADARARAIRARYPDTCIGLGQRAVHASRWWCVLAGGAPCTERSASSSPKPVERRRCSTSCDGMLKSPRRRNPARCASTSGSVRMRRTSSISTRHTSTMTPSRRTRRMIRSSASSRRSCRASPNRQHSSYRSRTALGRTLTTHSPRCRLGALTRRSRSRRIAVTGGGYQPADSFSAGVRNSCVARGLRMCPSLPLIAVRRIGCLQGPPIPPSRSQGLGGRASRPPLGGTVGDEALDLLVAAVVAGRRSKCTRLAGRSVFGTSTNSTRWSVSGSRIMHSSSPGPSRSSGMSTYLSTTFHHSDSRYASWQSIVVCEMNEGTAPASPVVRTGRNQLVGHEER